MVKDNVNSIKWTINFCFLLLSIALDDSLFDTSIDCRPCFSLHDIASPRLPFFLISLIIGFLFQYKHTTCFIMVTLWWFRLCVWGSVSFPLRGCDDSDEEGSANLTGTALALGGPLCSAGCPIIFYPSLAGCIGWDGRVLIGKVTEMGD